MPIYFETVDGPKEIPYEILEKGDPAVSEYIAAQGWQPPPPPAAVVAPAAPPTEAPAAPFTADEEG